MAKFRELARTRHFILTEYLTDKRKNFYTIRVDSYFEFTEQREICRILDPRGIKPFQLSWKFRDRKLANKLFTMLTLKWSDR
jgi:hypothetical protein